MEEERIRDIEEILVDLINGRSVNPELQRNVIPRQNRKRNYLRYGSKSTPKRHIYVSEIMA